MGAVGGVATNQRCGDDAIATRAPKIKKIFSGELSSTLLEGSAKTSLTGILIAHTRPPTERDRTFTD
jgi:hypothetical protein